jgi:hypothetical protein
MGLPAVIEGSPIGRETAQRDGHRAADVDVPIAVARSAAPPGTASGFISTLPRTRVALFRSADPLERALSLLVVPVAAGLGGHDYVRTIVGGAIPH